MSVSCNLYIIYRYDSVTGIFTVPSGGDGFYYLSLFLVVINPKLAYFDVNVNGETVCTAFAEQTDTPDNDGPTSCNALSYLTEGK